MKIELKQVVSIPVAMGIIDSWLQQKVIFHKDDDNTTACKYYLFCRTRTTSIIMIEKDYFEATF